jgi:hypothetical protein
MRHMESDAVQPTRASSRRDLLRRSLALMVAAPAVAVLGVGPALADDDNNQDDQGEQDDRDKRGNGRGHGPAPVQALPLQDDTFNSELTRVSQASADFSSSSPGTDPLTDGRLRLRRSGGSEDRRAAVALRGAMAGVSYDVAFVPMLASKVRESLGTIGPTDGRGNLNALTPAALSGANRTGVFVLTRHDGTEAGQDEFVSTTGV